MARRNSRWRILTARHCAATSIASGLRAVHAARQSDITCSIRRGNEVFGMKPKIFHPNLSPRHFNGGRVLQDLGNRANWEKDQEKRVWGI